MYAYYHTQSVYHFIMIKSSSRSYFHHLDGTGIACGKLFRQKESEDGAVSSSLLTYGSPAYGECPYDSISTSPSNTVEAGPVMMTVSSV